ncbi:ROK family protein [Salinibacter ruber]|jgi:glucokinase|uniref:ROK family protein n=1 Tax=Salinibacter ruber TaxID=146919 RepID=UPI002169A081|nr:ROK family protein [Salinibacter ruber]MCS3613368.1 glucokinase [Salinibacter ruber]MCS4048095.1 glucokinase [Salinibacter ruber]
MVSHVIGVDLGGTKLEAALVNRNEGVVSRIEQPTKSDQSSEHVEDQIANITSDLIDESPSNSVDGIGIGAPGTVNWEQTTVSQPPNFKDWGSVNLRSSLQSRLDNTLPVVVENDANVAALGSSFYGAGQHFDSFIMVTLGTGVGGGIIYQNKIFRGSTGGSAEIGHMSVDYEGPCAESGVRGAVEGYLGKEFLVEHTRRRLVNYPGSIIRDLADSDSSKITPRMIYEAASRDDEFAQNILAWAGHKLGCVLGSAVNLLDIRTIVVGGGISKAGDYILGPARDTLPRFTTPGLHDNLRILQEEPERKVSLLGAAYLVLKDDQAQVGSA